MSGSATDAASLGSQANQSEQVEHSEAAKKDWLRLMAGEVNEAFAPPRDPHWKRMQTVLEAGMNLLKSWAMDLPHQLPT